jgi:hypothetical protein
VFSNVNDQATRDTPRELQARIDTTPLLYFSPAKQGNFRDGGATKRNAPLVDSLDAMTKLYLRYYGDNVYLLRLNNMGEY